MPHHNHRLTRTLGWVGMIFGFSFALLAPINNLVLVDLINKKFSDEAVNEHVLQQLQTNPGILLTALYLASAASKAILESSSSEPTLLQAGNPIIPTFLLSLFIWNTFICQLLLHFDEENDHKDLSWDNIASMNLPRKVRKEVRECDKANTSATRFANTSLIAVVLILLPWNLRAGDLFTGRGLRDGNSLRSALIQAIHDAFHHLQHAIPVLRDLRQNPSDSDEGSGKEE